MVEWSHFEAADPPPQKKPIPPAGKEVKELSPLDTKAVLLTIQAAAHAATREVASAGEKAAAQAGKLAAGGTATIGSAARRAAEGASTMARSATEAIKKSSLSTRIREARVAGFRDGIRQGVYLAAEQQHAFYLAYAGTLNYLLRCDGEFDNEEANWLDQELRCACLDGSLSKDDRAAIHTIIAEENPKFDGVKALLDKVSLLSLEMIAEQIRRALEANGQITQAEEEARALFQQYVDARTT